jgi:hypothetical protein
MALLTAINEGRVPKLAGTMATNIANSLFHAPTVNITMQGDDRDAANQIAGAVTKALDAGKPDLLQEVAGAAGGDDERSRQPAWRPQRLNPIDWTDRDEKGEAEASSFRLIRRHRGMDRQALLG